MTYKLFMHVRVALEFYKQACDVYITCHLKPRASLDCLVVAYDTELWL